eukprot:scaffold1.g5686.t1
MAPSATSSHLEAKRGRRWLVITSTGETTLFTSPKLDISPWTGVHLQLRDLRLLDPLLTTSYPSAILTRNGALVANLEAIKLVITEEKAFLTNLEDPTVANFATELCRRLAAAARLRQAEEAAAEARARAAEGQAAGLAAAGQALPRPGEPAPGQDAPGQLQLPFELQVLEAALETVCARLERQAAELEAEANPVLDAMTAKVTQPLASCTPALLTDGRLRMQLKEVLEKLLDDEEDMRDMNLSAVAAERLAAATRRTMLLEGRSGEITPFGSGGVRGTLPPPAAGSSGAGWTGSLGARGGGGLAGWESVGAGSTARTPGWAESVASSSSSEWEDAAVEVVEALLQSFFFSVDATHDRLRALQEYVQDTEDLVAMELDNARNSLVRLDMVLTCFNASMSFIVALSAIFAMNLQQSPDWAEPDEEGNVTTQAPYWQFVVVNSVSGGVAILIMVGVMAVARWRRLL